MRKITHISTKFFNSTRPEKFSVATCTRYLLQASRDSEGLRGSLSFTDPANLVGSEVDGKAILLRLLQKIKQSTR